MEKIKGIISIILRAIALAMGVAVIVITTINNDVSVIDSIRMLAIAIVSLSIVVFNSKSEKND